MQCTLVILCLGMAASSLAFGGFRDGLKSAYDNYRNRDDQPDTSRDFGNSGFGGYFPSDNDFPGDSVSGRSSLPESSQSAETTKHITPAWNEESSGSSTDLPSDNDFPGDSIKGKSALQRSSKLAKSALEDPEFEEGDRPRISAGLSTDSDASSSAGASTEWEDSTTSNGNDSDVYGDGNLTTSLPEKSPREGNAGSSCALSCFVFFITLLVSMFGTN